MLGHGCVSRRNPHTNEDPSGSTGTVIRRKAQVKGVSCGFPVDIAGGSPLASPTRPTFGATLGVNPTIAP
jgi:hypothetical protein